VQDEVNRKVNRIRTLGNLLKIARPNLRKSGKTRTVCVLATDST